ncbi:MAG: hypothetical protein M1812_004872 [Candelaria pacifica]|nr:MAG: hypothetical protein M1812_004872 [Candelaria pacifica]
MGVLCLISIVAWFSTIFFQPVQSYLSNFTNNTSRAWSSNAFLTATSVYRSSVTNGTDGTCFILRGPQEPIRVLNDGPLNGMPRKSYTEGGDYQYLTRWVSGNGSLAQNSQNLTTLGSGMAIDSLTSVIATTESIARSDCCLRWGYCNIDLPEIHMFYFPVSTGSTWCINYTTNSSDHRIYGRTAEWESGDTLVVDDYTYTYPSVYLDFGSLSAADHCGGLGGTYSPKIAFAPGEITTGEFRGEHTGPFDPRDMPCPNFSAWGHAGHYGYQPQWNSTYNPFIHIPSQIYGLDPAWSKCTVIYNEAGDPPRALAKASALDSAVTVGNSGPIQSPAKPAPGLPPQPKITAVVASSTAVETYPSQVAESNLLTETREIFSTSNEASPTSSQPESSSRPSPEHDSNHPPTPKQPEVNAPIANADLSVTVSYLDDPSTASRDQQNPNANAVLLVEGQTLINDGVSITIGSTPVAYSAGSVQIGTNGPIPAFSEPSQQQKGQNRPQQAQPASPTVIGGFTFSPLAAQTTQSQVSDLNTLLVAGQPASLNAAGELEVAGQTLRSGGPPITISGTPLQFGKSGLILGTKTVPLNIPSSTPIATIANLVISAPPSPGESLVIQGETLLPNGAPVTINGTPLSLGNSVFLVGSSTVQFGRQKFATPIATIADQVITSPPSGSPITIAGQTITPNGAPITISGTPLSLGDSQFVVGSSTFHFSPQASATPIATIANQVLTSLPPPGSPFIIAGQTVTPNGTPITISGTPLSLGDSQLIIGSQTIELNTHQASNKPLATIANQVLTSLPPPGSPFIIGSQTITPNSAALTIDNTPISLDTSYLLIGTRTFLLSNNKPTITTPPPQSVFTIGNQIFTAKPTGFIIASGITLLPGASAIVFSNTLLSLAESGRFLQIGSSIIPLLTTESGSDVMRNGLGDFILKGLGGAGGIATSSSVNTEIKGAGVSKGGEGSSSNGSNRNGTGTGNGNETGNGGLVPFMGIAQRSLVLDMGIWIVFGVWLGVWGFLMVFG